MATNLNNAQNRQSLIDAITETGEFEDYMELVNAIITVLDQETVVTVDDPSDVSGIEDGMLYNVRGEEGFREYNADGEDKHLPTSETVEQMVKGIVPDMDGFGKVQVKGDGNGELYEIHKNGEDAEGVINFKTE